MRAKVTWAGGTQLDCENERGQSIDVDWEDGPSPMQIFLQMIGACSIVDVVVGLKNREFGQVWVDLDADRREEYPRSFTKVNMIYHVEGDVPRNSFEGQLKSPMKSTAPFQIRLTRTSRLFGISFFIRSKCWISKIESPV